jgi:mannose-6-phosphate isomerase-like protein (cupin superfamily)
MDLGAIKDKIVTNVYKITADKRVPLHKHNKQDEIFYCIKGEGFGVLENSEVELTLHKAFIVPAGTMHALRTDTELFVSSFLVPIADSERLEE